MLKSGQFKLETTQPPFDPQHAAEHLRTAVVWREKKKFSVKKSPLKTMPNLEGKMTADLLRAQPLVTRSHLHSITGWLRLQGTFKIIQFQPLPWAGCPQLRLHPTCGLRHLQGCGTHSSGKQCQCVTASGLTISSSHPTSVSPPLV